MSVLTLYDPAGQSITTTGRMVDHEGVRQAVATAYTGTISPGHVLTFSNGATGVVVSFSPSTRVLQFFLTGVPHLEFLLCGTELPTGANATGTGGSTLTNLTGIVAFGDEYTNLSRAHLYVKNASASPIYAIAVAKGRCSQKFYHPDPVVIPAGHDGPLKGWTDQQRFTDPRTGRVKVVYCGSAAASDLGVMAVLL